MALNEMPAVGHSTYSAQALNLNQQMDQAAALNQRGNFATAQQIFQTAFPQKEPDMAATTRRLVQVFIVDPHESVPLADCLLYKGDLQLTDLTDQELFYELDIKQMLDAHNDKRRKIIDKKVKERVEHLEPARIRDLKMQIVTVAQF